MIKIKINVFDAGMVCKMYRWDEKEKESEMELTFLKLFNWFLKVVLVLGNLM